MRTVGLKLHCDIKVDDIPHQLRIAGELTLAVVPGRAPLCLRCKSTGHIRRDCKVPRCSHCRWFGHDDAECARKYGSVTGPVQANDASDHLMEEVDSEETTGATCSSPNQGGAPANQGDAPLEPRGKPEDGLPHEFMEGHGEQVDASREERTSFGVAEETQQEPERMTGIDSESGNVTGKRPHDRGKNERRPSGAATDEPLTKTTHARRPPFRSRPNLPTERNTAETPPLPA
ncbi:hypothetical protein HPB50_028589 [Hyalomma asiaticum]|nr:hypothetical protein HPB50_028589 [Hyalomma asiaticum]